MTKPIIRTKIEQIDNLTDYAEDKMLTKKQYALLMFIDKRLKESGISPSFEEMKEALDLRSKSGIHRLISALEERGFLKRLPHKARALEVVKLPDNKGAYTIPSDVSPSSSNDNYSDAVEIPLYGKIAAGTPIEALRDESEMVSIPSSMIGNGDYYALTVEGDSMMEAGILSGDTVIIRKASHAHNGEIVVAVVEGYEVTLKRYKQDKNTVSLIPENRNYEVRQLPSDKVIIQGTLSGLIRNYN